MSTYPPYYQKYEKKALCFIFKGKIPLKFGVYTASLVLDGLF